MPIATDNESYLEEMLAALEHGSTHDGGRHVSRFRTKTLCDPSDPSSALFLPILLPFSLVLHSGRREVLAAVSRIKENFPQENTIKLPLRPYASLYDVAVTRIESTRENVRGKKKKRRK